MFYITVKKESAYISLKRGGNILHALKFVWILYTVVWRYILDEGKKLKNFTNQRIPNTVNLTGDSRYDVFGFVRFSTFSVELLIISYCNWSY